MSQIEDALAAIELLEPGESPNYTKIADEYGVVRSTLTRRHQGVTQPYAAKATKQQKLNPQQEQELVEYIEGLSRQRIPPTREMVRNFASAVATKPVSKSWVTRFINKHNIHLISQ